MVTARQTRHAFITPEEYLQREAQADEKSEYYDGEIVPMAGASVNHNRITRNMMLHLMMALADQSYEVFASDMRLAIPSRNIYTYPDIVVIAGAPVLHDHRDDTILNPVLIVEVLSESTKHYDRGEKFESYRTIPSLHEYLLVDQSRYYVEHCARTADNTWLLTDYRARETRLTLSSVPCELSLRDLYERVEWDRTEAEG